MKTLDHKLYNMRHGYIMLGATLGLIVAGLAPAMVFGYSLYLALVEAGWGWIPATVAGISLAATMEAVGGVSAHVAQHATTKRQRRQGTAALVVYTAVGLIYMLGFEPDVVIQRTGTMAYIVAPLLYFAVALLSSVVEAQTAVAQANAKAEAEAEASRQREEEMADAERLRQQKIEDDERAHQREVARLQLLHQQELDKIKQADAAQLKLKKAQKAAQPPAQIVPPIMPTNTAQNGQNGQETAVSDQNLSNKELQIVQFVVQNPKAKNVQIANSLGIHRNTVGNYLTDLKERKVIEKHNGSGWRQVAGGAS